MAKKKRKATDATDPTVRPNDRAELHDKVRSFTDDQGKSVTMRVRVNVRESWLEYALHRCWIDQRQYQAGMTLRGAAERSSLHTAKAADYSLDRVDKTGYDDGAMVAGAEMAHYVVGCIVAVDHTEYPLGQVCRRVAMEDQGSRELERVYRWRNGLGMMQIKAALDTLAKHIERYPPPQRSVVA